ncbi:MAG TPA: glycosyltransferase family 2 protein [Candidatus Polarisedimenticolia bacterium]|jgi:cellulose synthase/poly-beta-1,6-N-acetylglucosamine synthase-like glycosyltransferase|nr:glycosyltransferase family 2 protein [Candidatus Polarisedimenticolia bacterium]
MGAVALFWISVILIGYTYLGYPLLIRAWAARHPGRPAAGCDLPSVSVVIVAHDEGARIAARIENLLALSYPKDRVEILVGSDGSTDDTAARARTFTGDGVRVDDFKERRGKAAVLGDLLPLCRGEIVVLADARQRFEATALEALLRPFGDPAVGAVGGELILTDRPVATTVSRGVGLYWRCETAIRASESRIDSTVGASGAVYAIRRALFEPIPADTILDDVLIPMRIARRGYRVVFEAGARAYDQPAETPRQEFVRKVRTIAGNFQLFARELWLLDPRRNRLWLQTVSHKGLRLLGPVLLAAILGSNVLLADRPLYAATLLAQGIFYAAALGGALAGAGRGGAVLAVPYTVCLLNWATAVAFLRVVTGRQRVTWERAPV